MLALYKLRSVSAAAVPLVFLTAWHALFEIGGLEAGETVLLVSCNGRLCGAISVADVVRDEAVQCVQELKKARIGHIVMLTGDNAGTARAIAKDAGVDHFLAERLGIRGYSDKTEDEWLRELTKHAIDDYETFRTKGLARLPAPDDAVAFAGEQ